MELTRRRFLSGLGVVAAGGVAAACTPPKPKPAPRPEPPPPPPPPPEILVLVTLYGGNDGLNTVIPYTDPAYTSARGTIALGEAQGVHVLGEGLALHPELDGLKAMWDGDDLAIVRGVGYPNPDLSHFRSMDIYQSGVVESAEQTGWVGRWLDLTGTDPLRAVTTSGSLPRSMRGAEQVGVVVPGGGLKIPGDVWFRDGFATLAVVDAADPVPWGAAISRANADLLTAESYVGDALKQAGTDPVNLTSVPGQLADRLEVVYRLIKGGLHAQVYEVSIGGFDTHDDQLSTQARLLPQVGDALRAFHQDCDATDRQVVSLTYSEFGRRVKANQNGGTDHGTAGVTFVAGRPVNGGFYGDQPSLTDLTDGGDLEATTDFRSVYATAIGAVLGTDPADVLGQSFPTLAFL